MNPHTPPPPNDDELTPEERELAALYRRLPQDEPGHAVDDAILAQAAQAARETRSRQQRGTPRWVLGLATAAVLVLAGGLAWRLQSPAVAPVESMNTSSPARSVAQPAAGKRQRVAPPPPPVMEKSYAPAKRVSPAQTPSLSRRVPAPPAPPPPARKAADRSMRSASAPMAETSAKAAAIMPETRIRHIRRLLAEGHRDKALAALHAFEKAYPDYALPDDLQALKDGSDE